MDPILKEERREMKRLKAHYDWLGCVADGEYGIPTSCPCGGRIVDEVAKEEERDFLPGKRFFTCNDYKADGLHFRQPWVLGVQEEISNLNRRLTEAEGLKWQVYDMNWEIMKLNLQVQTLKDELEKKLLATADLEKIKANEETNAM